MGPSRSEPLWEGVHHVLKVQFALEGLLMRLHYFKYEIAPLPGLFLVVFNDFGHPSAKSEYGAQVSQPPQYWSFCKIH